MVSAVRKQFEENGEQGSSIFGRKTAVVILKDTPTQTSNRPGMVQFNPLLMEENEIRPASSPHSSAQKERSSAPKSVSSYGTQHTSRLCARATNAKTTELLKGVLKLIKTKGTPRTVDADIHHGIHDTSDSYMLSRVERML